MKLRISVNILSMQGQQLQRLKANYIEIVLQEEKWSRVAGLNKV